MRASTLPKGVTSARFRMQLNKAGGRFWVDELSAAYLAPAPRKDDRVARLLFATTRMGNLLFPDDSRRVDVTVEAVKPLREGQQRISYDVRDYSGAEQMRTGTATLKRLEKKGAALHLRGDCGSE